MNKFAMSAGAAMAFGLSLIGGASLVQAQNAAGSVERLDPRLDALVAPDTKPEVLLKGDGFFEGPIWYHGAEGNFLIFSDLVANRIDKWEDGKLSTFLDKVYTGKDPTNAISFERDGKTLLQVGPNASTLDGEGRVVFCAMGSGKIMRREKNGSLTTLASSYEGHHLNAPNDLVISKAGAIYFTDIRAGTKTTDQNPPDGVPHTGVYMLKDGKLTLLDGTLQTPNGIAFSPDEKHLYVNDIRPAKVMVYDVAADGTLANAHVFIDMKIDKRPGLPDGMKIDVQGNVWDSGPGGLWIIAPDGTHLGTILTPERLSNLAWGDADGKTLYTTGSTLLTRIHVKVAGIRP
jgi:gluconolactonase